LITITINDYNALKKLKSPVLSAVLELNLPKRTRRALTSAVFYAKKCCLLNNDDRFNKKLDLTKKMEKLQLNG